MKRREGKTALAVGNARGIGRAICEAPARESAQVAVADRLGEDIEGTATAIQNSGLRIDTAKACAFVASGAAFHRALSGAILHGGNEMI